MSILNFGSCSIDHVYTVAHFAEPGETLTCTGYEIHPGGKGLNQSVALAAAGARVRHAGKVGRDGEWLLELLAAADVDTRLIQVDEGPSGHTSIQVTPEGENSIVLFGGANRQIDHRDVDRVLDTAVEGEFLLVQNEISALDYLIEQAAGKGMRVVFNAAPMTREVRSLPLAAVELLVLNEIEGEALTGRQAPAAILSALRSDYPNLRVLLTLGGRGALFAAGANTVSQAAPAVRVVDTTGAGDTFTGFFLAGYAGGGSIEASLELAARAAAVCVTRPGAAGSIPDLAELQ